ncbi:tRNA uridine-5-carboxymethylaminomethyl(34) synthesis GTPase MnmE [Desulfobacula sp.]|uniref:tRNA uridine-5-carboxymethylaminomethyl(34) synthesis GTPase MnmE n=1 Tax=Desulfobacula sp. TaxID=2593537 RepID=UPI0025BF4B62|nr:tRNA uridine-5-carboxymethylaminomethyl(34) synthesis GTPase MnmE [Desulfobacula sp.]MBC2704745.1 tRNA uridine-5-carboxymethylaminomethyl(34) synthesis GTPase MnmE [Desulfobacula sp.]
MNDTIAAIATPYGSGGIGVIRISGPKAFDIASKLFSKRKLRPEGCTNLESHKVYHGYVFNNKNKEIIDEVLLIPMKGPSSYTAEDVVEIQAHSGTIVLRTILDEILSHEARLSEPGEFTKRAFLNQRIDLTQAEAVADIINAKSAGALKFAASQNLGALKNQIRELREKLIHFLSLLEVNIDFPDDVEPFKPSRKEMELIDDVLEKCREYVKQHEDACFLKDGIRIAICGAPNVGKSSLMNRLLEQDRAIVTPIPGTTRDPIEEGLNIDGIPFVIIDTAGIHQSDNLVEIIGIEKAKDHITASDLVLFMKEPGTHFTDKEFEKVVSLENQLDKKVIFVVNKIDLDEDNLPTLSKKYRHIPKIEISALFNNGIKELKQKIVTTSIADLDMEKSSVIPNLRHKKALEQTIESLISVKTGLAQTLEEETLVIDIKNSIDSLGTITGETASLDILDRIFDNFCIGK